MKLLILGGTGPAGIKLIEEALAHGHTVVVYARSPEKLPESISNNAAVTVIEGQLTDVENVTGALERVDAILSALGPGASHPGNTPLAHAYELLIAAMKQHGVKRLIALGTASIKDGSDKFSLAYTAMITGVSLFAHSAYKDIVAIGETIRGQGGELDWTIARVPILTNSDTREVVAGYVGDGVTKTTLSRAGFAAFMVGELEENEWVKKAPLITAQ